MKAKAIWIWAALSGVIFTGMDAILAAPVPDTGQTACYDAAGNVITGPAPGKPFYGQDGSYTIHPPSCTNLDEDNEPTGVTH